MLIRQKRSMKRRFRLKSILKTSYVSPRLILRRLNFVENPLPRSSVCFPDGNFRLQFGNDYGDSMNAGGKFRYSRKRRRYVENVEKVCGTAIDHGYYLIAAPCLPHHLPTFWSGVASRANQAVSQAPRCLHRRKPREHRAVCLHRTLDHGQKFSSIH